MVRHRFAKPLFTSSSLVDASKVTCFSSHFYIVAEMAKLVDARDLKSLGLYVCAGSTPALGTRGFLKGEALFVLNPHTPANTQLVNSQI